MAWRDRVRLIDPDRDEGRLASFQCARIGEPWAAEVEEAIRDPLALAIRRGRSTGLGCFDGDALVGVASLTTASLPDMTTIGYSSIIATAVSHRRLGIARALKLEVMDQARRRGYPYLESRVHESNSPMLELNRSLGADMRPLPPDASWRRSEHISCMIKL